MLQNVLLEQLLNTKYGGNNTAILVHFIFELSVKGIYFIIYVLFASNLIKLSDRIPNG